MAAAIIINDNKLYGTGGVCSHSAESSKAFNSSWIELYKLKNLQIINGLTLKMYSRPKQISVSQNKWLFAITTVAALSSSHHLN